MNRAMHERLCRLERVSAAKDPLANLTDEEIMQRIRLLDVEIAKFPADEIEAEKANQLAFPAR